MMWYLGQPIVCVNAGPCQITGKDSPLVEDKIYHIERINFCEKVRDNFGFSLTGVPDRVNDVVYYKGEPWRILGYDPNRFRPVLPDKHEGCDEEFKQLLNNSADRRVPVVVEG